MSGIPARNNKFPRRRRVLLKKREIPNIVMADPDARHMNPTFRLGLVIPGMEVGRKEDVEDDDDERDLLDFRVFL